MQATAERQKSNWFRPRLHEQIFEQDKVFTCATR